MSVIFFGWEGKIKLLIIWTNDLINGTLGAVPNVQRAALVNMGDLAAYDYTKQFLMREFGMADNALVHGAAAFTAGFVAAVLGTPADVLKTRLMNQPVGPDGR